MAGATRYATVQDATQASVLVNVSLHHPVHSRGIVNFIYTCMTREYLFNGWLFGNLRNICILDVSSMTNLPFETFYTSFPKLKAGCQLKTQFRLLLQKHVVRLVDSVRLHPRSVHHTHFKLNLGKYIRVCFEYKFQIWQNLFIDLVYPFPFWRCKTYLW